MNEAANDATPKVSGVGRDGGDPSGRSITVYFDSRPTDDQLRAFHDSLRAALTAETKIPGREEIARLLTKQDAMAMFDNPDDITEIEWGEDGKVTKRGPAWTLYLKQADEMLALLKAPQSDASLLPAQAEEWRDIASAPKDGTPILLYRAPYGGERVCVICASAGPTSDGLWFNWRYTCENDVPFPREHPTHWKPLPPPPDLKSKDTVTK